MQRLLCFSIIACFCSLFIHVHAQERPRLSPRLSPFQKIETKIGLVDVSLDYSRPSMRGRKIFGELEPYGKVWRTGANINTRLTFKDKVLIGGKVLEPGSYTLFTKPGRETWEIYLHTELNEYGVPDTFDLEQVVISMTVTPLTLNRDIETLTLTFDDLKSNSAVLGISWERTYVPIPIQTPVDEVIQTRLDERKEQLISDYAQAGWNYYHFEKNNEKGLEAINLSIHLTEQGRSFEEWAKTADVQDWSLPWTYMIKSEIHAELGQMPQARQAAERSLFLAKKINSTYYLEKNRENMAKWGFEE